jgi:hypothetical protein
MPDSQIANNGGPGNVDSKRLKRIAAKWGTLPEKERRRVLQDLTRGMSSKHAQAIQNYFRRIGNAPKTARSR